jgi:hypothetical protein
MRLKGISLPVNAVIIIALAVMVLLLVAAFLGGGITNIGQVNVENAWTKGCDVLKKTYNCRAEDVDNVVLTTDVNGDGENDNLLTLCHVKFYNTSLYYCRNVCCNTVVTEGMACEDDVDCRFGPLRDDWICNATNQCQSP